MCALDGISFQVPAGRVVGLLGPNGSGKTTTVGVLSTTLRPDAGQATVFGLDVVADAPAVRGLIGFAGQYAAVDGNLTGRENLALIGRLCRVPRRQSRMRAEELLTRFGLAGAANRLVRTYSGGMRRRLDVAAALVHRPPVLFLDEPTTGLDPDSRTELWGMVRELVAAGTTVLLTTQYLEEADALADDVVILNAGRIVEVGTPAELKARVGTVVIELTFATEPAAHAAADLLASHDHDPRRTGAVLRLPSPTGSAALVDVLHVLTRTGPHPIAVGVHEPTLDDVFRTLTTTTPVSAPEPSHRGAA